MIHIFNLIFYSIFGFIYETTLKYIFSFNYDSGILYGPYTLLYGVCITLMFMIFDYIKKHSKFKKIFVIFIYFLLSFIIITAIEFITGYTLEKLFNLVYWNYKECPLHIGKYISIPTSLFWSIGIILIYHFIKPITDKLYLKTNKKIIIIVGIIIIIDFILTLCFKLKIKY